MEEQALWIVTGLGVGTLLGVFWKMKGGFGPLNLRAVGLVLITILAVLLAITESNTLNTAMGILGAIAGYLFGAKAEANDSSDQSSVRADNASFGDNAKVAGRDINETINNINGHIEKIDRLLANESLKLDKLTIAMEAARKTTKEYLLNTIYRRQLNEIKEELSMVISRWEGEGWKLVSLTSDYHGIDGMALLFERDSADGGTHVYAYHGSDMEEM